MDDSFTDLTAELASRFAAKGITLILRENRNVSGALILTNSHFRQGPCDSRFVLKSYRGTVVLGLLHTKEALPKECVASVAI